MTHKYHINAKGERRPCTATARACKYTPADTPEQELQERIRTALTTAPTEVAKVDLIATQEQLEEAVAAGRLTRSRHPEFPVSIYKYTRTTQFGKDWDEMTLQARGLIVHDETGEILARPFQKFFNLQEDEAPDVKNLTGPFTVTEKLDGSLGILWVRPDGTPEVSTSGGFRSQQTKPATEIYMREHHGNWTPNPEYTYLYEIILPNNRIVLDYGDREELVLLGAVNKHTGRTKPLADITEWNGPRAETKQFNSLEEVINYPDAEDEEGHIIHWHDSDQRVKLKLATYLSLHRNLTGVTVKHIWEKVRDEQLDDWRQELPEEFEKYVNETVTTLQGRADTLVAGYKKDLDEVVAKLPEEATSRELFSALSHRTNKDRGVMISMFTHGTGPENFKLHKEIWKLIRPEGENGFTPFFYNKN